MAHVVNAISETKATLNCARRRLVLYVVSSELPTILTFLGRRLAGDGRAISFFFHFDTMLKLSSFGRGIYTSSTSSKYVHFTTSMVPSSDSEA